MWGSLHPWWARVNSGFFTNFYLSPGLLGARTPVMWWPPVFPQPLAQFGSVVPIDPDAWFPYGYSVDPD